MHYCTVAVQSKAKSVQYCSQTLATNFRFFAFNLYYGILVYGVIMCHTVIADVAT
jgi:hypothetical protein